MESKTKTGLYKYNRKLAQLADKTGWHDHYEKLKREFTYTNSNGKKRKLTWQQAAYIAWVSAPKRHRQPKTKDEMAEELNYKSRQILWHWEQKDWFKKLVTETQDEFFLSHLNEVRHRTVEAALTETGVAGVGSRTQYYDIRKEILESRSLDEQIEDLIEKAIERRISGGE